MHETQKAQLPLSELGEDRCFQIEYFGHGDIRAVNWKGPLDHEPKRKDGVSTSFGFAHGNDVFILASLAGYLKRLDRSDEHVGEIMRTAGEDILNDDPDNLRFYYSPAQTSLNRIARGEFAPRFDIEELGLKCLVLPRPNQPGLVEEVGGTGIYTRDSNEFGTLLVFAGFTREWSIEGLKELAIDRTADFCEYDIPVMARLICDLALGEYRKDIQAFLVNNYVPDFVEED